MGRVTSVVYSRTVNLGDFNSVRVEMTAEVDENENPLTDVLPRVKHEVLVACGIKKEDKNAE